MQRQQVAHHIFGPIQPRGLRVYGGYCRSAPVTSSAYQPWGLPGAVSVAMTRPVISRAARGIPNPRRICLTKVALVDL